MTRSIQSIDSEISSCQHKMRVAADRIAGLERHAAQQGSVSELIAFPPYYEAKRELRSLEGQLQLLYLELKDAKQDLATKQRMKEEQKLLTEYKQAEQKRRIEREQKSCEIQGQEQQPTGIKKPVPTSATAESLTKRGYIFLEDAKWETAAQYFDNALDINPEYAFAYVGLVCAKLRLKNESELARQPESFINHSEFRNAVRFADEDYRVKLKNYNATVQDRIAATKERRLQEKRLRKARELEQHIEKERQEKEKHYNKLLNKKTSASSETEFQELKEQFHALNGYKDTEALADECRVIAERLAEERKEKLYKQLVEEKDTLSSERDALELNKKFRAMWGYKNSEELANECRAIAECFAEKRKEEWYNQLVEEKKNIASWKDALNLSEKFREMNGYKNANELADECLTNVTLSDEVTFIGDKEFYNCSSLTSITIPDSITGIGNEAFSGCSGLTYITIPGSVKSIGNIDQDYEGENRGNFTLNRFLDSANKEFHFIGAVFKDCSGLTGVTISDGVAVIGDAAFCNCTNLTSVAIPGSVTTVGNQAFKGCSGLANVTIFSGVRKIGHGAFSGCSSLTSITIPGSVKSIGNEAFASMTVTEFVDDISEDNFVAPDKITLSIFLKRCRNRKEVTKKFGCTNLVNVTLADGVKIIGDEAFSGCSKLSNITIPGSVKVIGDEAFYDCISLKSLTIPEGVTTIGERAFGHCSRLTSIIIPSSVTDIYGELFEGCNYLTVYCLGSSIFHKSFAYKYFQNPKYQKYYNEHKIEVKHMKC